MNIQDNTNISSQVANSISRLNLNIAQNAFNVEKNQKNDQAKIPLNEDFKEQDKALIDKNTVRKNTKNPIDVAEIQKYAQDIGENITIDDINYALMYGRSVIADYSV